MGGDGGGGGFDGAVGVDSFARCSGPMNVTRPLQSAIMCVVDRAGVERLCGPARFDTGLGR